MRGQVPKKVVNLGGKIEGVIKDLDKVRGEIAVTKMRLAQAEEQERELLRQVLGLVTDESDEMEGLWSRQEGRFEAALLIGQDVAVVKIEEDYFERPALHRHAAVNVGFIPLVKQAL
jgi:hypothetical protein